MIEIFSCDRPNASGGWVSKYSVTDLGLTRGFYRIGVFINAGGNSSSGAYVDITVKYECGNVCFQTYDKVDINGGVSKKYSNSNGLILIPEVENATISFSCYSYGFSSPLTFKVWAQKI